MQFKGIFFLELNEVLLNLQRGFRGFKQLCFGKKKKEKEEEMRGWVREGVRDGRKRERKVYF